MKPIQMPNEVILLVDDNVQNLKVLVSLLEPIGYDLILCSSAAEALQVLEEDVPDLILLDVMMPEMDGYTLCERLKAHPIYENIPILFLTAKVNPEDIEKGFLSGGDDYISKPFSELELKVRIRHQLKLKRLQNELMQAAIIDPLTQLYNRRYMMDKLEEALHRLKRNTIPFSVVIADIDYFKSVNDTHGHNCGDVVLKTFAKTIGGHLRAVDTLCRWGGEEFLILLPETSKEGSMVLCERIRKSVEETPFVCGQVTLSLTLTLGSVTAESCLDIETIIKAADDALFKGKQSGRNKVVHGGNL